MHFCKFQSHQSFTSQHRTLHDATCSSRVCSFYSSKGSQLNNSFPYQVPPNRHHQVRHIFHMRMSRPLVHSPDMSAAPTAFAFPGRSSRVVPSVDSCSSICEGAEVPASAHFRKRASPRPSSPFSAFFTIRRLLLTLSTTNLEQCPPRIRGRGTEVKPDAIVSAVLPSLICVRIPPMRLTSNASRSVSATSVSAWPE